MNAPQAPEAQAPAVALVDVRTSHRATVERTTRVAVPDDTPNDQLLIAAAAALAAGGELVFERVTPERDQEMRMLGVDRLETATPGSTDALQEFSTLYLREKALEAQLKKVKAERARVAPKAEMELLQTGLAKAPMANGATVYVSEELYAGRAPLNPDDPDAGQVDVPTVCEAMKANGLGHMVGEGYHAGTLKSYFKNERKRLLAEKQEAAEANGIDPATVDVELDEILPEPLRPYLVVNEVKTLKAVKGG